MRKLVLLVAILLFLCITTFTQVVKTDIIKKNVKNDSIVINMAMIDKFNSYEFNPPLFTLEQLKKMANDRETFEEIKNRLYKNNEVLLIEPRTIFTQKYLNDKAIFLKTY